MLWIQQNINDYGLPIFVEFFVVNLNEQEFPQSYFPITRAYLKFIDAVFSKETPSQFLQLEYRTNVSDSILQRFLFHIYQPVIQNFSKFIFKDIKDFLKLYYIVLKLTNHLLNKFSDVLPQMKSPLSHRYPQYDELLRIISDCMNTENVEFLVINALMLADDVVKGRQQGLTNKFWLEQLKQGGTIEDSKQRVRVQKMIQKSLKTLNTLLELSYLQIQASNLDLEQKPLICARTYYVLNLQCITNISNLVKNPGQWEQYQLQSQTPVSYSLFNIVQYYVKPHMHLCPFMSHVQIQSIRFFFNCCKIWETQPLGQRVSLESTLRTADLTSQDIRNKYVHNLKYCSKQIGSNYPLEYLCSFLDFLIVACSSQSQFVMDFFKEQETVIAFIEVLLNKSIMRQVMSATKDNERNPVMKALAQNVESKIIILLSEMSSNKICDSFLRKLVESDLHLKIYENIVRGMIEEANIQPTIEYSGEQSNNTLQQESITNANNNRTLNFFLTCQALITIKYYMKFLADEYQRDIGQVNIRKAIKALYDNQRLIRAISMNASVKDHMKLVVYWNDVMKNFEKRNRSLLRDFQSSIETRQRLTDEQISIMRTVSNKFITGEDCPVFLNNLDCQELQEYLKKSIHPYSVLQTHALDFNQSSKLGAQFTINTSELISTAKSYFYDDKNLLAEVNKVASQFNMSVSYVYAYQQFIAGQQDFILSIGKSRMRENMRQKELVYQNRVFCTSLFNLVVSEDIGDVLKNKNVVQGTQNSLAKILIDIAVPLTQKLVGSEKLLGQLSMRQCLLEEDTQVSSFELSQNELDLDFLSVLLGALNSLAEIDDFQVEIMKTLDKQIVSVLVRGIPKIRQSQIANIHTKDTPQVVRLDHEKKASKLFINLVLQIFSLSIQIASKTRNESSVAVVQHSQTEFDYIQILSQVVKIMQETSSSSVGSCFSECLKIIEEGFNLVSNDNILMFMRKQDSPPVKVIVQKFVSSNTTVEEKIKIIEFLTSYARIEQGAEHLNQENILKNLAISQLMSVMNQIDFYMVEGETKRNPIHILWCHLLLFIRTLNHVLLPQSPEYRHQINSQLSYFWIRLTALLEFGMHLRDQQFETKAVSLALLEELELMTGIVSQYFDYTEEFCAVDFERYAEIKDKLLFGVMHIFTDERQTTFSSSTEQYLNGMKHDKIAIGVLKRSAFTGLDLAMDVQKVKIFFNVTSSLLNATMINANRVGKEDFINTWDPSTTKRDPRFGSQFDSKRSNATYIQQTYYNGAQDLDQYRSLSQLTSGVANTLSALQSMSETFKLWLGAELPLSQLHQNICGLFKHDEWITNEYLGLNQYFAGLSFVDVLEQFEQSLQMGYLSVAMLLQKLKQSFQYADQIGNVDTINQKLLLDFGDQIVKQYREFDVEIKRSSLIKSSVDGAYGKKIADFVDGMRLGSGGYRGGGTEEGTRSRFY